MIIVNQIKMSPDYKEEDLLKRLSSELRINQKDILGFEIRKRSIDARKKPLLFYVLSVSVDVRNEDSVLKKCKNQNVARFVNKPYEFKVTGKRTLDNRPVIIGAGPAGLFCAFLLASKGYKPLVLERGKDVDSRTKDIESFFKTGVLNPSSNVLFGEGGAGTFSDGKLNTLVKDKDGRNRFVLELLVRFGAKESILYDAKPHIGTDVLCTVIKNIRNEIISMGGEFRFNSCVTDIVTKDKKLDHIIVNNNERIDCDICVLAIGHSSRDTFSMLYKNGFYMEQKDFAVGFRIEHPQDMIDRELLTDDENILELVRPAAYKLTYKAQNDRGVYSFCMCPGGYVVNASSEENRMCVNGMSYSKRDGDNANAAIVVTVNSGDFGSEHPLAGIEFQRNIEENAFKAGNGKIPYQYLGDYRNTLNNLGYDIDSSKVIAVPNTKGQAVYADITKVLPRELSQTILEGIDYFDNIISGYSNDYAILSAVESRTSSPVRITRNDDFESLNFQNIYPCGEGAGYAGGITSAAMDGMKVAERVAAKFCPIGD